MAGKTLGPYEIHELIGEGGMGEVYRATDTRLRRQVAVKVLAERYAQRADAYTRFENEARSVASLNHPNVVSIFDIGKDNNIAYLVTELLTGVTLREHIKQGPLSIHQTLRFSIQIAEALGAAHKVGIVHRDLKPENVFVVDIDTIKLLDFGLAKLDEGHLSDKNQDQTQTLRTAPGVLLGTLVYMSPEQVRGQVVDHRTDIFSFGAMLYELLTGQRAFAAKSSADTMSLILHGEPRSISEIQPCCPALLDRIISQCLHKSAEHRFQSIKDLGLILEAICDVGLDGAVQASGYTPEESTANANSRSDSSVQQSVAVLPFSNTSADPDNEYLGDGIAEDITNALASLDGLRVAARSSAFALKGKEYDHKTVGTTLNVDTIVEGSVRRAGNRLRITAQLVNVEDGFQLWSERFDREMDDIFAVQDEIATAVANRLKVSLSGSSDKLLLPAPTSNLEAYDLFMRARFIADQRGDNLNEARVLYEKAIRLDPNFAQAHAGIAEVYGLMSFYGFIEENKGLPSARESAQKALDLDSSIADAKATLGLVSLFHDWDWPTAMQICRNAINEHGEGVRIRSVLAWALVMLGRFDEALEQLRLAMKADPLCLQVRFENCFSHYLARRHQRGIELCEDLRDAHPSHAEAYRLLALNQAALNQLDDAHENLNLAADISKTNPWIESAQSYVLGRMGRKNESVALLDQLHQRDKTGIIPPLALSVPYIGLGEMDEAMRGLKLCVDKRHFWMVSLNVEPWFDTVRNDQRFLELVDRVGINRAATSVS